MFGIILLICIYIVLGFMLAWIAGVVAREDVEVKTGVIILVLTGIASIALGLGLNEMAPDAAAWILPFLQFGLLTALIALIAKLSWKHSLIIALIYTVLITVLVLGLRSCM
ncbi:MAG: hypothetical protein WD749_13370 [Phycisphaerales bacterium]